MTTIEEIYYKLGLKLIHSDAMLSVYMDECDEFDIEVCIFELRSIRVSIIAKFDGTTVKVMRDFPFVHPIGVNPKADYRDIKDKIILILNQFSNILNSKSNQFDKYVIELNSKQYLAFD